MEEPNRNFVMVLARIPGATAPEPGQPATDARVGCVMSLAASLAGLGNVVEVWDVRAHGQPETEVVHGGVLVRRFAGDPGLIPKVRPCAWIPGWVADAAAQLSRMPYARVTLVTHGWEAGVAGRRLAEHFALRLVHVPHSLALCEGGHAAMDHPSDLTGVVCSRQLEEEREVCRAASRVLALTSVQRDFLVGAEGYRVPAEKVTFIPLDSSKWSAAAAGRFLDALSPMTPGTTGSRAPAAADTGARGWSSVALRETALRIARPC
jgi:hypothetical protein